jgi:glycosyltransferase involved in cell wall biosynthesis
MTDRDSLHVVHLVPALFGPTGVVGGAERYALELARAMAHEIDVDLVTFGERPRTERDGRFTLRVLGNARYVRGQRSNPVSLRLFPALRPGSIVHCHQQHVLASSLAALYCRATGRRVFVTDLGGGGWDFSSYLSTDSWYHGHLHLSEYSRKVLGHAANPRARVILGGVDTERFAPQAGLARSRDEVVFVGRLLPHKGVNDLIEALPQGMRLRVIGKESDLRYRQDLDRLAAGKAVTFQQDVEDAGLLAAYRQALCVVLPSVYRTMYGQETNVPELLGQTLLEAMACGAATIATTVASLPEVVEDGVTGFLVPPNDPAALGAKLDWLRAHPDRAAEMGAAGRRRVQQHFTWPAVVRRCLTAYGGG